MATPQFSANIPGNEMILYSLYKGESTTKCESIIFYNDDLQWWEAQQILDIISDILAAMYAKQGWLINRP
jgi:hypothetical protein